MKVNYQPTVIEHLTLKIYVDNAIDELSSVRTNQDNDLNHYNLTNNNSITLITQAVNDNQVKTEAYVDQFHQKKDRSRRGLGRDFYDQSNDLVKSKQGNVFNDNKPKNLDSITVN